MLPGGSLKDTYPLAFNAIKYREQLGENPAAETPNSADVTIKKKLFSAAAQAELIRIVRGDFAYIQTWQSNAATMARARVNLRNHLITDLLEAGTSGYWGQTQDQTTGIDGQPFFSASHKVNPFNVKMTFHGATTWGNYVATAYPPGALAIALSANAAMGVPAASMPPASDIGTVAAALLRCR